MEITLISYSLNTFNRHETAGLNTFYQPADNGAGAIHMVNSGPSLFGCTLLELTFALNRFRATIVWPALKFPK